MFSAEVEWDLFTVYNSFNKSQPVREKSYDCGGGGGSGGSDGSGSSGKNCDVYNSNNATDDSDDEDHFDEERDEARINRMLADLERADETSLQQK